jgi:hypothetical protein
MMKKLKDFIYGFYSIYFAIMFRLDFSTDEYFLEIDRLAFYEEMCYGWRKMYLEGFDE